MRVFWLFFALLVGGGVALWWLAPSAQVTGIDVPEISVPPSPPASGATLAVGPHSAKGAVTPALVSRVDTRTVRLADRFDVTGNGSEMDPYRVSWALLGSAHEAVAPDGTLAAPPQWLLPLDGAWIELGGYVSTPIVTEETREVLFTMNRWDGCCIGIPPTPFDCLEVKLAKPISFAEKHTIRFGVMRGQLRIEPFAIGGVLLGLYRLENAVLTTQAN